MSDSPLVNKQLWCCWSVRPACGAFCAASTWWASKCWVALPDIAAVLSGECESMCAWVCFGWKPSARERESGDGKRRTEKRQRSLPRSRLRPRALWLTLTLSEGCLTLPLLSLWLTLCAATCMCVLPIDWWEPWAHRLDVRLLLFSPQHNFSTFLFFFTSVWLFTYWAHLFLTPLFQQAKASFDLPLHVQTRQQGKLFSHSSL